MNHTVQHDKNTINAVERILRYTDEHNGGTFYFDGSVAAINRGYIIGGIVPTLKIRVGANREAQKHWIAKWVYALPVQDRDKRYIGTWVNEGIIHVDLSEVVLTKYEAIRLANIRQELAVWDAERGIEVAMV